MSRHIAERIFNFAVGKLPDYAAINLMFLRDFGRLPDLKHPKTFNEKLAWRKLYQRDPRFSLFADKIAVKAEVAKLIDERHIIETLWFGDDPGDIPFGKLEPPYVVKVNHGNDGHIFIRERSGIDEKRIAAAMRRLLRHTHAHRFREWGYLAIPRKVLVERLITPGGELPDDYKFFVYHGRAHFIQFDYGRFGQHARNLYDREWNLLPVRRGYPTTPQAVPRPANLELMITIAEKIGKQFDFVRIDLYSLPEVYFGEATFYPSAGVLGFTPGEWDLTFGSLWSCDSPSRRAGLRP